MGKWKLSGVGKRKAHVIVVFQYMYASLYVQYGLKNHVC